MECKYYIMNHHTRSPLPVIKKLKAQGVSPKVMTDYTDYYKTRNIKRYIGLSQNLMNIIEHPSDKEWKVMFHDDVSIPKKVVENIEKIIPFAPKGGLVSFFNPTNKLHKKASEEGYNIIETYKSFWTQCIAIHKDYEKDFIEWVYECIDPFGVYSEDGMLTRYNSIFEKKCYVIVPGLIQHEGINISTFKNPKMCGGNLRNSATYDPSFEASKIDWKKAFANPLVDRSKNRESKYLKPYN